MVGHILEKVKRLKRHKVYQVFLINRAAGLQLWRAYRSFGAESDTASRYGANALGEIIF